MNVLNNARSLKVALAVSVALNLFAVAGGVTVWVTKSKADDRIHASRSAGREASFREIVRDMDPAVRDRVTARFRASAMAAKPDFEQSRTARREAIELSKAETFDPVAVATLLDQSRAAEIRGRTRLERDAIAQLATMDLKDRQALSAIFSRRGKSGDGERSGGPNGRTDATVSSARQPAQ